MPSASISSRSLMAPTRMQAYPTIAHAIIAMPMKKHIEYCGV